MRIALIGDIHLYRLWAMPWTLLSKRLFGQCSVWFNRGRHFDRALLGPVMDRVRSFEPQLVLFSGDLTSTAQQGEFDDARAAVAPLVDQCPSVILPGNHDVYTYTSARTQRMRRTFGDLIPTFPHHQPLTDRWHLLALDTAAPSMISSRGRVGETQLAAARSIITNLTAADGLVLLTHYPPRVIDRFGPQKWQHRLADRDQLDDLLRSCKSRVLHLHGHIHHPWHWPRCEPGLEHVIDICAGAPTLRSSDHPFGQGVWQFDLPDDPSQPLQMVRHLPNRDPIIGPDADAWDTLNVS